MSVNFYKRFAARPRLLTIVIAAVVLSPFSPLMVSAASDMQQLIMETVPVQGSHPISDAVTGLSSHDRAAQKGREIAKLNYIPRTKIDGYSIEITSMEPIDGGVQVFARAWDGNGRAIGFGKDGTVEIERFRIFNPPILVPDQNGPVIREWTDRSTGETKQVRFREDLREALLRDLSHTISVKKERSYGNIISGKIGNTTSTFRSAAGSNSPVDGTNYGSLDVADNSWATERALTDGSAFGLTNDTSSVDLFTWIKGAATSGNFKGLTRSMFLFDTSAIPDGDTVGAATFSVVLNIADNADSGNSNISLVSSSPASNAAVTTADHDQYGTTELAAAKSISSLVANDSTFNDYSLNSSGLSNITKTGVSKFGIRMQLDLSDSPTPQTLGNGIAANRVYGYFADQTGTTIDPKLVVEHSETPIAPTGLQGSPVFSAIFQDTSGDVATYYRLQIGAYSSSGNWDVPYWDSGKQTLSSSTPVGQRTPSISSTSTLTAGQTYFWRIKFWDQSNVEGAWSTTSPIFMISN